MNIRTLLKRLTSGGPHDPRPPAVPAPLLMALEPRIVYDASVAAVGVVQHHAETPVHAPGERPALEHAAQIRAVVGDGHSRATAWTPNLAQANRDAETAARAGQVVFVDSGVANYQQLIAGLPSGTRYVVLNSTTDGLEQIAHYLQQHPGVESIHLLSHGADGEIQVGSTWLNQADLSVHGATLARIGAAMEPGEDFLIYGCDVAQQADGQMLVQQIASISHLNVAASTDATGAAALGGDWTLEYATGALHTSSLFAATTAPHYGGLLSVYVESYDGAVGYDTGGTPVASTALDGLVYTGDQAVEYQVVSGSLPNSGSGGELIVNVQGTPMSTLTMQRQDGSLMAVQSFDIDIFVSNDVTVQALDASGNVVGSVTLDITANAGSSLFHVDLSHNQAFSQVKGVRFMETSGNGTYLSPTLDNFSYIAPSMPPTVTATGGSTSFVAGDNVASTPVAIDSGLTLTDGNSSTAASATVSITGNLHASEDVLAFSNTSTSTYGNISASYNAVTGVLSLSSAGGTATIAQWQAALRAVTYTDTAVTPNPSMRGISFQITSDGYTAGNTTTKSVTVSDVDQTPIVTTAGGAVSYRGGTSAVTIDGAVAVSDRDNTTQSSGTVAVAGGFHSGDTLAFTNDGSTMGNIIGSYNSSTGVLTLTSSAATATDAQWASALSAVTFSSTSATLGLRTISFATNDGMKTSVAAADSVNVVTPVQVTTDSGSAAFVAGDNAPSTPVVVDAGLTVTDTLATTLGSATAAITGGFQSGQDVLAFTNDGATMGNIVASYDAPSGVLSLTSAGATATLAQWQSALRSITYTDTLVTPNNATRTVSFSVVDGSGNASNSAARTVTVTDTDQSPIVTVTGATTSYVGASPAVTIDGGVSVSDLDNSTQTSATVAITTGFQGGDVLSFTNDGATMGNIQASYSAGSGVLLLTSIGGSATNAQWASAFSAVAFSSTSTTYGDRAIWFQVNDGTKNSAQAADTVHMTAPPAITTDPGSAAFVAGDNTTSTPVAIDAGLTVTDGSASTLGSTTVAITGGFHGGEDLLSFTNDGSTMGNIVASYNSATGVLTLTSSGATATLAQWQGALQSITYTDTQAVPNTATRTIGFTAVDGAGNTSATATRTVTITATDQSPIVTTTGGTTNYVGGSSAVTIDGGISVIDLDNATQSSATVSVTAGFHAGDTLAFANINSTVFGNIVGSYNSATGVLTLTSSGAVATDAQWASALSAVTFSAGSSATPGNRTIAFVTSDGTKNSAVATDTVDLLGPPTITTDTGSASFVEADNTASTPVTIDPGLALTDGVSPTLASTTVAITGNFHAGEDVLAFVNTSPVTYGNLSASFDGATGVLTLTSAGATATLTQWQAALRAVTYTDTAVVPNTATRTIAFTAVDTAATTSNTATRNLTVTATDQTPVVATSSGSASFVSGDNTASAPIRIDPGLALSDRDNATLASATVSIIGNFRGSEDLLGFVNDGIHMGNIAASYDAANGVLTLASSGGTATVAQWQAALASVTYADTALTPDSATRSIGFTVSDGTKSSATGTRLVTVVATDQTPVLTTPAGSVAFTAGDNSLSAPVPIDTAMTLSDRDNATLASATVAISGNFRSGEDVLGLAYDGTTMGNIAASYDAATGVLRLASSGATATLAQWQAALGAVTYANGAVTPNTATRTISFVVNDGLKDSLPAMRTVTVADTDQTPVVTTSGGSASFAAGDNRVATPVRIDAGIGLSDRDNPTLATATVAITGNFRAGEDVLALGGDGASVGNITATYDATTGVLTLVSPGTTATIAQWQAALASVTYTDTAVTPYSAARTIGFTVGDGMKASATATRTITVADVDQTPVVATSTDPVVFGGAGHQAPVVVDPGIALSDRDNATLASATVAITGNFHAGEDLLAFANDGVSMGNISASFEATTGVLKLVSPGATATTAQWRAALASVTYANTSITATAGDRTVAFVVNDGTVDSAMATRSVTVKAAFKGGTFLPGSASAPAPAPTIVTTQSTTTGDPVVLNALAAEPVLGEPVLSFHTATFSAPGMHGGGRHDVLGQTQVGAQPRIAPEPIAAPFSLPTATVYLAAPPEAGFALALAPWAAADARVVGVTQADGHALPGWLHFDPATGQLRGRAPVHGQGPRDLRLLLILRDQRGHATYRELVIDFGRGHATSTRPDPGKSHTLPPAARPSLGEQLERERQSLHVARPARSA